MRSPLLYLCFMLICGCGRTDDPTPQSTSIDVSKQWRFDASGNLLTGPGDSQWKSTTFTSAELNLFASMDTASLTGTTVPSQVLESNGYNAIYPNPFILSASHAMGFQFPNGYSGQFVVKLVYVDSLMNPIFKKAFRLQSNAYPPPTTSGINFLIMPSVPVGRHRLYYMLCAASNPRFYTSWGNVQCIQ
jgi:hypothetical protein